MSDTPNNGHCQQNLRRVVISSLIGAVIEWYDFFLYGVVAGIVFNKIYFPDFDPTVGTVLAFATFAVGFVARPLGGIVFGHFGDKIGRKSMLVLTMLIMGVASTRTSPLPTCAASSPSSTVVSHCPVIPAFGMVSMMSLPVAHTAVFCS